jgi:hypothetical protein
MALVYKAMLTPTKLELLVPWLSDRSWCGLAGGVDQLGSYRFDDPAGEVGVETLLLRTGDGPILHVPLTYRSAPLPGADEHLVGTGEHPVLGNRWVYDGCADPVYALTLATAILTGGTQVDVYLDSGGELTRRAPTAEARGSGAPGTAVPDLGPVSCEDSGPVTVIQAAPLTLAVARVVGADVPGTGTLTARWAGGGSAIVAAVSSG